MQAKDQLGERKMKILHAIIQTYLETGEPVGSRTISKYTDLNLSSATIRNEMADLEELGYILQPHTSAGRIPSDKGYRLYVDMLMEEKEQELNEMQEQMLEKADKMELIIQKAVELGAYEIIPVETKRCVVKLDGRKSAKKTARWQQIAESAAKQSKRMLIPNVHEVLTFREALKYAESMDVRLVPYELARGMQETKEILAGIEPGQSVGIFIGPEGGFEEKEIEAAIEGGAKPITLGRRILRTETAGLAILSVLMFQLEN